MPSLRPEAKSQVSEQHWDLQPNKLLTLRDSAHHTL